MAHPYLSDLSEGIWFEKWRCDDAEVKFQMKKAGTAPSAPAQAPSAATTSSSSLVSEIAKARQHIQNSLKTDDVPAAVDNTVMNRLQSLEKENKDLRRITDDLRQLVKNMENRIIALETKSSSAPVKIPEPAKKVEEPEDDDDDDDDIDLFGSDDEEEAAIAEQLKAERVAAYTAKKAKKAPLIAKSNIILDVKPWDDETDMKEMERCVRTVEMDGLLWGASKLVPLAYGIRKLQICCVVEDDKVGTDDLEEKITAFEDFVQSVDIAAFNKI